MTKVFLAGASGVIGRRVCEILLKNGYEIYGTTRSKDKANLLNELGVKAIVLDVFDAKKLQTDMAKIRPQIVLHQLTDLPKGLPADKMSEALVKNAILRDVGTRNLVEAAILSGVEKMVAQSIGFIYENGTKPYTEASPLLNFEDPIYGETSRAVSSLESQVLNAPFTGIVLRNGLLYGAGTGFDEPISGVSSLHADAAALAVVLAMKYDKSGIFNIADKDDIIDCQKAIKEIGWDASFRLR
ncbi:NAD-dependent epimerase/dehydratase family protein [Campylobacter gastrosuis]|uniref:NAD(P)-dependent oxidoreductase n=1 Tax=Campylobacter gastrosuis TaxID=2974576 RepID=A0ABT7HRE6_9BACT|nr:NAD(P)-dependent oxidoreductase [Campylobacter gastrosuis]MDL0089297.1 NAD(P)-dependent oxidoreductase [Campylobacter gastrosuis]